MGAQFSPENQAEEENRTAEPEKKVPDYSQFNDKEIVSRLRKAADRISKEIARIIVGQTEVIDQVLITLFAEGHCLLIGVPGLGKTLLIKSISQLLDLKFSRIQFTPDLMPSDITGTEIIQEDSDSKRRDFKFIKGPIFTNILLADEINRTPPKTQAALLEAMQEKRVTSAGKSLEVPCPFFVLATQNPIEHEGTYPLPEAQLDRFMLSIYLHYPSHSEEMNIVKTTTHGDVIELKPVLNMEEIVRLQQLVKRIPASDHVVQFAVNLVRATRPEEKEAPDFVKKWVSWGAGPRASQNLIFGGKARAILKGRNYVAIEDVKKLAMSVLKHRISINFTAEAEGIGVEDIINKLLDIIPETRS
ncbi:AAA family ATPase [Candidatus Riflebacteria bacterium]